jgi:hypothetical protein
MTIDRRRFVAVALAGLGSAAALDARKGSSTAEAAAHVSRSAQEWTIPRPMFWSFENHDPRIAMAGYTFSFQIFTVGPDENTYSLDAKSCRTKQNGDRWLLEASQLSWPGQQGTAPGSLHVEVVQNGDTVLVQATASAPSPIHAIKIVLHGLPPGAAAQTGWQVTPEFEPVTSRAVLYSYPRYTGGMPLWFLGRPDAGIAFSSLDTTIVAKRFCAVLREDGVQVQLIVEPEARDIGSRFAAPAWEIKRNTSLTQAIESRCQRLETGTGLQPWTVRTDVAPWVRKITLVVTLHGMHWSGFVFNDYAQMLETVKWVTRRIPGERVLFFLAGWEGRYYRCYGDSKPNNQMGGADGLRQLVRGIHATGAHVMAMFAGNAAGPSTPGLDRLMKTSVFHGLPGSLDYSLMRGYQVDWAEIRVAAGGGGAWLNPGAPGWRDHLIQQVSALNEQFQFDGNFFDTQPNTGNDFQNDPLEGLRKLADELRSRRSELLLATESWFDLSLGIVPCSQTPDGPMNWSQRYQRRFAHLSLGEPSRGSTGVHEVGYVDYELRDLLETFDWPTLSVVDGTIAAAPEKAMAVIAAANAMHSV